MTGPTSPMEVDKSQLAPLIALVGCDGCGKTTLVADLVPWMQFFMSAQACYLGLGSSVIGEKIKRFKIGGKAFEGYLAKKAARAKDKGDRIPGPATALILYIFSSLRLRRFKKMQRLRAAGVAIITDRYPQTEVAGYYDGPLLGAAKAKGWFVQVLARKEQRKYDFMASYLPDLVIKLHVSVETSLIRKPESKRSLVERKVTVTPGLTINGAVIRDVDAEQDYATVAAAVKACITQQFALAGVEAKKVS
jgi:thymidylate kinase